jgi:hypothetical protein
MYEAMHMGMTVVYGMEIGLDHKDATPFASTRGFQQ